MSASILRLSCPSPVAGQEAIDTYIPTSTWVCPDQHSRRDLVGFAFAFPTGPDHPTLGEITLADNRIADILTGLSHGGDRASIGELSASSYPNSRLLAFWSHPCSRSKQPDGLLLFRTVASVNAAAQVNGVTIFLDYCWLAPELRGLKYSHYFACYFRAFVFWHPINPWFEPADASIGVAQEGISVRLVARAGPPSWIRLCHNIASIFSMNMCMWKSDQERGRNVSTPYPAKWAVCRLDLDVPPMPRHQTM